jgi:hypothetical protein
MPQYRFQVSRGKFSSGTRVEMALENKEAAWNEAAALCADLARDIIGEMKSEPEWLLEASDEAGHPLFKFRFVAEPFEPSAVTVAAAE